MHGAWARLALAQAAGKATLDAATRRAQAEGWQNFWLGLGVGAAVGCAAGALLFGFLFTRTT